MKRTRKLAAIMLTLVTSVILFAVCASGAAAAGIDKAKLLEPNTTRTYTNANNPIAQRYIRLELADSGKLRFHAADENTDAQTTYELLNSKGKTIASGEYSVLTAKPLKLSKKGTYYIKLTLQKDQYIKRLYYTFTADGGENIVKSINAEVGKTLSLSEYTKNFGDNILWSSSDEKTASIGKNGVLTAIKEGKAKITAYSAKGDYLQLTVTVKQDGTKLTEAEKKTLSGYLSKTAENNVYFQEGQLTEVIAVYAMYGSGGLPDGKKPVRETDRQLLLDMEMPRDSLKLPEAGVDAAVSDIFGIKPTHSLPNYYNGYYYYPPIPESKTIEVKFVSEKAMPDKKILAVYSAGGEKIYALVSRTNSGLRLCAVCQSEEYALRAYNKPAKTDKNAPVTKVEYEGNWRIQTVNNIPVYFYATLQNSTIKNTMVTIEIYSNGRTLWQNSAGKDIVYYDLRMTDFYDGYANYFYNSEKDVITCSYLFNDGTSTNYVLTRGYYKF